jgi:ABC-type transport system involved in multi-copper enzyme maturation permease subunit
MGPLFYYELVRLARKGRTTLLRCAYALAGLVTLYFAYHQRFPSHNLWNAPFSSGVTLGIRDLASLARSFVTVILWVQTVAIFLLTPAYLAGAIAGERERGTLDLLLTSHLSDREIVLGKLAARLVHLGGILLAGLPLLAATQLWGGVDFGVLLAAFAVTALNLLTVGSICVLYSARERTTWAAITTSYAANVILFGSCLAFLHGTPVSLLEVTSGSSVWWGSSNIIYLVFGCGMVGQVALVLFCLTGAVRCLRSEKIAQAPARDAGTRAAKAEQPADKGKKDPAPRLRESPPVGDHPLLWLEIYRTRDSRASGWKDWLGNLVGLAVVVGLLAGLRLTLDREAGILSSFLRLVLVGVALAWCWVTASLAVSSLGLERERRTLDGLLTLPCSRSAVLGAKWLGSVWGSDAGYIAGAVAVIGLLCGVLHPLAVPLLAISVAGHLCFWASLGVWLSTVFRGTLRARVAMTLAVSLVFYGSWFLAAGDPPFDPYGYVGDPVTKYWKAPLPGAIRAYSANPLRSWWFLAFRWWGPDSSEETEVREARLFGVRVAAAAGGALAFALAGGLLWLDACRRFRKEGAG